MCKVRTGAIREWQKKEEEEEEDEEEEEEDEDEEEVEKDIGKLDGRMTQ